MLFITRWGLLDIGGLAGGLIVRVLNVHHHRETQRITIIDCVVGGEEGMLRFDVGHNGSLTWQFLGSG